MRNAIVFFTLILLFSGCGDESDSTTAPVTLYHEFTIQNFTIYAPKQLTRLEVTPVGGGATLFKEFVCNDQEEEKVNIPIPEMGAYQVTIYSSDGQSMWWDSVSFELPGQSIITVRCYGGTIIFSGYCAGIAQSGTDMVE